jgi:hypothetical protein
LAAAEAADPGNARYAYLAAKAWLQAGCKLLYRNGPPKADGMPTYIQDLEITDTAAFDRGLAELRRGMAMPRFERYAAAMLRRRLDALPEPHDRRSAIANITVAVGALLPDPSQLRYLTGVANTHGRDLLAAGQVEAARPLLDASPILAHHLNADSFTLIDVLVAMAIAHMGATAAEAYAAAGMAEEAAARQALAERAKAVQVALNSSQLDHLRWVRQAGLLSGTLLIAVGETPTADELRYDRLTDYVLMDRLLLELVVLALAAAMVVAMVATLRWRWLPGAAAIPILLLPRWQQAARALALWVGLPVAAYLALTLTPLAGRHEGLMYAWPRTLLLALLLAATIVAGTAWASRRLLRRRCQELGLPVPPAGSPWWARGALILGAAMLVIGLLQPSMAQASPADPRDAVGAVLEQLNERHIAMVQRATLGLMAALLGLGGLVATVSLLAGPVCFGLYTGTLARSLLPLLAGAILLLGLLRPVGAAREAWLVRHDPLFGASRQTVGLTAVEDRATQRLKAELAEALTP